MGSRSRSFFSSRLRGRNAFVVLLTYCIIVVIRKVGYFVCMGFIGGQIACFGDFIFYMAARFFIG